MNKKFKLSDAAMSCFIESGMTRAHAEKMGIRDINTDGLAKLFPKLSQKIFKHNVTAHEIPYFGIDSKPIDYSRYRLHDNDSGLPKYLQLLGTKPHFYFPPFVDWEKIASNPTIAIIMTEGERKAAKACLCGFPTIGLGGVWNWFSNGD